jgi:hypothetical protein
MIIDNKYILFYPAMSLNYTISGDTIKYDNRYCKYKFINENKLILINYGFKWNDSIIIDTLFSSRDTFYRHIPTLINHFSPPFNIVLDCNTSGISNSSVYHLRVNSDSVFFSGRMYPFLEGDFCGKIDSTYISIITDAINSTIFPADSLTDLSSSMGADRPHYYISLNNISINKTIYTNEPPIEYLYLSHILFNIPNHFEKNAWNNTFDLDLFYKKTFSQFKYNQYENTLYKFYLENYRRKKRR